MGSAGDQHETPMKVFKAFGIAIAVCFVSWFGGNLVFGILVEGTWVFSVLAALVPEAWFMFSGHLLLWLCRLGMLLGCLFVVWEHFKSPT